MASCYRCLTYMRDRLEKQKIEYTDNTGKHEDGEIACVFTTLPLLGQKIRVIKYDNKLWFMSADLRRVIGIEHGGRFCEKAPEEMKKRVNIKGCDKLKRIISPDGLKLLIDKARWGRLFRYKFIINLFIEDFLEKQRNGVL